MNLKTPYRSLIRPLREQELNELESSILKEGIREKIILWNDIIVDGHNRYDIATRHNLTFDVLQKEFDSEIEVKEWMIKNQLGRRNVSIYERSILALELEEIFKVKAKDNLKTNLNNENRMPLQNSVKASTDLINTQKELARIAEVSHDTIAKVKVIEDKASPEVKELLRSGEVSINQAYKDIKKEEKEAIRRNISDTLGNKELEVTEKKYRIVYADPPWKYGNSMPDYFTEQADHYRLMDMNDICNIPVKDITEDNAVLFLWVTSPILEESFQVINAWGFKYKSSFVWDKIKHNMGHYNSVRHEFLLVATKGSCKPDLPKLLNSVISIERTEHSKKPDYFREMIGHLYYKGNKIELFARQKHDGWDCYGNEIA